MTDRPLVITQDDQVLDDLLRIAAAAGVEVMHCRDPESRASWRSAPVVLIDAGATSQAEPGRRRSQLKWCARAR